MGVPYFLKYIYGNYKKCILKTIPDIEYIFIDCNCILHEVTTNLSYNMNLDKKEIFDGVVERIKFYKNRFTFKYCVICIDGIPPLSKYECQKKRRKESNDVYSMLLTPGTNLMKTIDDVITKAFTDDIIVPSSIVGEGELKIVKFIRNLKIESYCILTLDSDLIILSLITTTLYDHTKAFVYYMSKESSVDILLVKEEMCFKGIFNSLFEFVILCGNDYIPNHIQTNNLKTIEYIIMRNIRKDNFEFDLDYFINLLLKYKKKEVNCNCSKELVKYYFRLIKWFTLYYISNENYQGINFNLNIPCSDCISKYKEEYNTIELEIITDISLISYIKFILPEYYHKDIENDNST